MKQEQTLSPFRRNGILLTLLLSSFITAMSTTVTGNMIPNLMVYFSVSSSAAQWLTSGATLLSGIIIPITAVMMKRMPNKPYYLLAMSLFTIGSLGACVATDFPVLLCSRLIQALGCGMLLSFSQIVILTIYPREKHGVMMAAYSMAATVSSTVGPTYAGLLMDSVGWRGVFVSLWIVGALLIVCGIVFMCNITPQQPAFLPIGSVALSSAGFAFFIIGLNNMKAGAFHLKSGGVMLLGLCALAAFSVFQLRARQPMLNLRVFQYPQFRLGVFFTICLYLISMGNAVILPILAKIICGFSDTSYGLATVVGALISVFATLFAGKIYDKVGIRPMSFVTVAAYAAYSVLGVFSHEGISIVYIGWLSALQSVAMAAMISPTTTIALSGLHQQDRVDGSAVFNTLRQIASSLASTTAVLLFALLGDDLPAIHGVYLYFGAITLLIAFLSFFVLPHISRANSR